MHSLRGEVNKWFSSARIPDMKHTLELLLRRSFLAAAPYPQNAAAKLAIDLVK